MIFRERHVDHAISTHIEIYIYRDLKVPDTVGYRGRTIELLIDGSC